MFWFMILNARFIAGLHRAVKIGGAGLVRHRPEYSNRRASFSSAEVSKTVSPFFKSITVITGWPSRSVSVVTSNSPAAGRDNFSFKARCSPGMDCPPDC